MDKLNQIHDKLANCYSKVSYKDYFFWTEEMKEETCLKEREALTEYLNSDALNFENLVKHSIANLKGNLLI
jgi:hypothetical protein